ncbi:hypothetical protein OK016_27415 [Vibrio chagasii]|nr:hypothetical protein [Vibrio chagasii]
MISLSFVDSGEMIDINLCFCATDGFRNHQAVFDANRSIQMMMASECIFCHQDGVTNIVLYCDADTDVKCDVTQQACQLPMINLTVLSCSLVKSQGAMKVLFWF